MTVSAYRTVTIQKPLSGAYGTIPLTAHYMFPIAEPGDSDDYSIDLTAWLQDVADTIAAVSVSVMPSGAGELVPSALSVVGGVVTCFLTGGVAGRRYTISYQVTTEYPRSKQWLVRLWIDPALASFPLPPPPSFGFCPPVTWTAPAIIGAGPFYFFGMGGVPQPQAASIGAGSSYFFA